MIYSQTQLSEMIAPIARKHCIPAVYLFGSYANGTADECSDIDLIIDTTGTEIRSLLQLSSIVLDLEQVTGKTIDLITKSSLIQETDRPSTLHFRETVNRDKIMLYSSTQDK